MKPTPDQIRQALRNHRRPGRTPGARLKAALEHVERSKKKTAGEGGSQGVLLNGQVSEVTLAA